MCVCVCLSDCLSTSLSAEPHARSLPIFLCVLPMAVSRSSSDGVTKSQGEGAILGLSGPFKSIGNLGCRRHCLVRCKSDNSVTSNVMQQKGSFRQAQIGIWNILSAGDAAYWPGDGSA